MSALFRNLFSSLKGSPVVAPERMVGIDVGSSSVKVVEFEFTERAPVLRTYGELQLGPYADQPLGNIVELEQKAMVEAVVDVLREAGVTAKAGVYVLPLSDGFVTVIPVTLRKGEELDTRIPVEARKYIPVPLTEITLDWVELPPLSGKKGSVPEVLLVALQNERITQTSALLAQIEMGGQPTELEIFSTIRATSEASGAPYGIIDLGARFARLYIVREGLLDRVHRVTTGGSSITKMLAQMRNVDFATAENIKRNPSANETERVDVRKATAAVLDAPLGEFRRLIGQYQERTGMPLSRLVLTGGVAATPFITEYLSDTLGQSVTLANPFSHVGYPAFMEDTLTHIGPSFTVSIGAALRLIEG
jgi:type IV pilus assembly protein PilM